MLRFSFIFFTLKTAAIAAAPNIPLLFAAESLQVLSYALYAPAIVAYVTLIVPYDDAAKGQSLAFSMTTIGGVLASLISGRLLDVLFYFFIHKIEYSFRSGNGMDRSGGLRRRRGHRLPRAGKAEEVKSRSNLSHRRPFSPRALPQFERAVYGAGDRLLPARRRTDRHAHRRVRRIAVNTEKRLPSRLKKT